MVIADVAVTTAERIERVRALQPELAANGFTADATNTDPTPNFDLLNDIGLQRLFVPQSLGGDWDGTIAGNWRDAIEASIAVSTGDGPTGQNWGTTNVVAREIFRSSLPSDTLAEIARRLLEENLRLCAANAETGAGRPVTGKRVEGGIVLDGTKSFVTNSGGNGIAFTGFSIEGEGRFHALVELTDPVLNQRHDWDNMGQRGTQSQTIDFDGAFVRDGWYMADHRPEYLVLSQFFLGHAALMQGIGEGAYIALIEYVKSMKRGMHPKVDSPAEDALMTRRIGEMTTALSASRALLLQSASLMDSAGRAWREGNPPEQDVMVEVTKAKYACVEASLKVSAELFELTGARSTSNKYRYDRFWRNARTFGSHDPLDVKAVMIGQYELTGAVPLLVRPA